MVERRDRLEKIISETIMNTAIYIPSHRRIDNQKTFDAIPKSLLKNTFIVVDKKDYKGYKKRYGTNVILCPEEGICKTRQWIIENSREKYALMFDDDMSFARRNEDMKLKRCKNSDIVAMVKLLESWLEEGLIHVGISQRFGNNRVEEDYMEITRMNNAYAYNCKEMVRLKKQYDIGFDTLEKKYKKRLVMEDFFVTLSLLQFGFKNRVTYEFAWSQDQSGAEGGCSLYRNSRMQEESAKILAREFPKIVNVVKKESKTKWGGFDSKIRTDVVIQWKKSFKSKRKVGIRGLL